MDTVFIMLQAFLLVIMLSSSVVCQSCVSPTNKCSCFKDVDKQIINCRYKNLTEIPIFTANGQVYDEIRFNQDFYPNSEVCNERGCNNIIHLQANAFANLKVRKINLQKLTISTVDIDAFRGLTPEIEEIIIEGNETSMPYSALANLDEYLKVLHLINYGDSRIENQIVFPFPNLQSLTLDNWRNLMHIEADNFRVMQNLSELKLLYVPSLTTLPVPAIQKFLKLKKIEIKDSGLSRILGDSFTPLNVLNEVTIKNNKHLQHIDQGAFNGVTDTIEFLDLDTNDLINFEFLKLNTWSVISHLNIGYNKDLGDFPSGIFSKMPTLSLLNAQDIRLSNINKEMFTGLSQLHTLDLSYNGIGTVSTETFKSTPTLVELLLVNQNKPIDFPMNAFSGIETSLETLALDGNSFNLSQFWNDLSMLTNLHMLEMKNTGIDRIPDQVFHKNTKLTEIYMSENNITMVSQETFYGPRDTLRTIDLNNNNIKGIDQCTLYDFPTKPRITVFGNKLNCNCDLVWLYDWFKQQSNQEFASADIGTCFEPPSLANKEFKDFSRSEMCSGTSIPVCPDLYATTTSTTTTTTTTTTPPVTTPPVPDFELLIINQDSTSIEVSWIIYDRTHVTALKLELISNYQNKLVYYPGTDATSYTIYRLLPANSFTLCLILKIEKDYRDENPKCQSAETLPPVTVPSSTIETTPKPESQIGLIVGASVGGVVLVALIIAILVVLLRSNKPKKQKPLPEPVSFTMKAEVPHAGGTARRFAKKVDKEGATPDDINITVISNGDMTNRERMSAGSYQALNEKGVDQRPMPSSPGHYTNNWEERPLPKAPYSSGATGHGYVNDRFKRGAEHLPETSKNEYSEVRY